MPMLPSHDGPPLPRLKRCLLGASIALTAACGARSSLDALTEGFGGAPFFGGATTAGGYMGTGSTNPNGGASSAYAKLVATSIGAGSIHTCATLTDGTVRCWGDNFYGELGNGSPTTTGCGCSTTPVRVSGITNPAAVAAGLVYTCAMLSDGTVQCWGANFYGQLGNGSLTGSSVPTTVSGITDAIAIATAVSDPTCAVLSGGSIQCWGYNYYG